MFQSVIEVIRWEPIPAVAGFPEARTWLNFQACRGLARNTLDAYGRNLDRYLRFLEPQGKKPWEVKADTVGLYLRQLLARPEVANTEDADGGLSNATVQQHLASLRLFYDYLVEEELCRRNPFRHGVGFASRPLVRREHRLPWIPNEEEWNRFLAAATSERIRNRLMLAMSYDAGLRREELCLLDTGDIDPAHRTLRIRAETTKSRRSRVLPYSVGTGELLGHYLQARRIISRERGRLFLSESRRNRGRPVSIWSWSKVVAAIAQRAGLIQFSPHTTRHLCLADLARAGWDIQEIATFAGHRRVQTTRIYVHLSARDLAAKFNWTMSQIHERRMEQMREVFG